MPEKSVTNPRTARSGRPTRSPVPVEFGHADIHEDDVAQLACDAGTLLGHRGPSRSLAFVFRADCACLGRIAVHSAQTVVCTAIILGVVLR